MSQYAPKGVKSLCITSSQTVYVRKPDLVSCKTQERLGGRPMCEIYLNTYFQRARLGGRLICEIGLYASIYGSHFHSFVYRTLTVRISCSYLQMNVMKFMFYRMTVSMARLCAVFSSPPFFSSFLDSFPSSFFSDLKAFFRSSVILFSFLLSYNTANSASL